MAPTVDFGPVQYGCTKYKRRMVLYESVSHPGKRFEFCYSSSYQDKRGVSTAYYKCVGCMHAKRYNDGRRIPKIAVREMRLVNSNPDRPSNFPHFCQPIDSALSDRRQRERETGTNHQMDQSTSNPMAQQFPPNSPTIFSSFPPAQSNQETLKKLQTTTMALFGTSVNNNLANAQQQTQMAQIAGGTEASAISAAAETLQQMQQNNQPNLPQPNQIQHLLPTAAAAHQIHPGGVVQAAMQQQIQQLAANCFVSPAVAANTSIPSAASQHFFFGMGMAGTWPSVTTSSNNAAFAHPSAQQMRG